MIEVNVKIYLDVYKCDQIIFVSKSEQSTYLKREYYSGCSYSTETTYVTYQVWILTHRQTFQTSFDRNQHNVTKFLTNTYVLYDRHYNSGLLFLNIKCGNLSEMVFWAFDCCRFCVVFRFSHPRHNGQWPPISKDFLSQILSIIFIFLS